MPSWFRSLVQPFAKLPQDLGYHLIQAATASPSSHNSQPWKFAFDENSLHVLPDYHRRLPIVDPDDREFWISLGCATESIVVAALHHGLSPSLYLPSPARDTVSFRFKATPETAHHPLHGFLNTRQTNRSVFADEPLPAAARAALEAVPLPPDTAFRILAAKADRDVLSSLVTQANTELFQKPGFVEELLQWTRFNKEDALASRDGLYTGCAGAPDLPASQGRSNAAAVPLSRRNELEAFFLSQSMGCLLLFSKGNDKTACLHTGQLLQRLFLTSCRFGLSFAYANQPIEIPQWRQKVDRHFAPPGHTSQILLRFGRADPMPKSYRRDLSTVLCDLPATLKLK